MLMWGPMLMAFLMGLVIGTRFKNYSYFTLSSFVCIFIVVIIFAYMNGQVPFYTGINISTSFISAAVGLIIGKLICDR
jgi:uncharacterized membrane protein AbrB (regulator of aidB expression)